MTTPKRITIKKPKNIESLELHFGLRLFALILDFIVIDITIVPLALMFMQPDTGWQPNTLLGFSDYGLLMLILPWIYFTALESVFGGSLGKLFVRFRIYNADGRKLSLTKAIVRFPLKLISIISLIGVVMIDVNKEKQSLHDLICGTIVRRR